MVSVFSILSILGRTLQALSTETLAQYTCLKEPLIWMLAFWPKYILLRVTFSVLRIFKPAEKKIVWTNSAPFESQNY